MGYQWFRHEDFDRMVEEAIQPKGVDAKGVLQKLLGRKNKEQKPIE